MRRSVLVLAALLLASHIASAQPALTPPITPVPAAPTATADSKDPSIAVLLSLGITSAGYVTLFAAHNENLQLAGFAATYLGPSTGQWYAGQVGGLGLGLRALGYVSGVYGVAQLLDSECDEEDCSSSDAAGDRGTVFLLAGAGLYVGSSIYDIVLARRAADSWNARHSVNLMPSMTSDASGNKSPGLVLTGRF